MVIHLAKPSLLLAGTIAFAVVLPGLALTGLRPSLASTNHGTALAAQPTAASMVEQLGLSEQQKQKIRAIRKARNQEIAKVLTEAQRKKLGTALRSGAKLGAAMQTLNLSTDQKQKVGTIVRKSNQAVEATLTPKQRQQLEASRKQHQATAQSPIE